MHDMPDAAARSVFGKAIQKRSRGSPFGLWSGGAGSCRGSHGAAVGVVSTSADCNATTRSWGAPIMCSDPNARGACMQKRLRHDAVGPPAHDSLAWPNSCLVTAHL